MMKNKMRWEMRTVVMKKVKKRKFWMKWKKQEKIKQSYLERVEERMGEYYDEKPLKKP